MIKLPCNELSENIVMSTNAERQAKYRKNQKEKQGRRLDMRIDNETFHSLSKLQKHFGVTKKQLIKMIALKASAEITAQPNNDIANTVING